MLLGVHDPLLMWPQRNGSKHAVLLDPHTAQGADIRALPYAALLAAKCLIEYFARETYAPQPWNILTGTSLPNDFPGSTQHIRIVDKHLVPTKYGPYYKLFEVNLGFVYEFGLHIVEMCCLGWSRESSTFRSRPGYGLGWRNTTRQSK